MSLELMSLSVVIVTHNEEENLPRTLASVGFADEIVVLDSGSTDRTVDIARSAGAKVFTEPWKGYAAQKNSAIDKATGEWVLALDADEVISPGLARSIRRLIGSPGGIEDVRAMSETMQLSFMDRRFLRSLVRQSDTAWQPIDERAGFAAFRIPFKHHFLGHWLRFGGMYPDRKIRLFRRDAGRFSDRAVHESVTISNGAVAHMQHAILHYGYPTLAGYLAAMDRYSTLAAQQMVAEGRHPLPFLDTVLRPAFTFFGRYIFLLGFLDGPAGLTFHFHHSLYIRAKYEKALALLQSRQPQKPVGRPE
jgi:glycosyltransferase involved in cell wall biosynthesis